LGPFSRAETKKLAPDSFSSLFSILILRTKQGGGRREKWAGSGRCRLSAETARDVEASSAEAGVEAARDERGGGSRVGKAWTETERGVSTGRTKDKEEREKGMKEKWEEKINGAASVRMSGGKISSGCSIGPSQYQIIMPTK
jgi:hypothetical protein